MVRQYEPTIRLDGKVAILTGGSSGIGKVTVRRFAELGAHVFVMSRNKAKTEPVLNEIKQSTGNDKVELIEVDFSSLAQVQGAAEEFLSRNLPLHILVCNAGAGAIHGATSDGYESTFATNYLSHFLLTQLLLKKLKESAPSRIVNVSSIASLDQKEIDYNVIVKPSPPGMNVTPYRISKLAQVLITKKLSQILDGTGVTTYSLHPGIVSTDAWRNFPFYFRWLIYLFGMLSEEDGALTTLYCSTAPELASESGNYYDDCAVRTPNPAINDQKQVDQLWDFNYKKELEVGLAAVRKASVLCQGVFKKLVENETLTKGDKSPVTVADFGAQAIVNHLLNEKFPDDPIIGEEDSKDLQENKSLSDKVLSLVRTVMGDEFSEDQMYRAIDLGTYKGGPKGRFWTLDPIDGTKGFLRGEQYAVCLSLILDGEVVVGIIGGPNLPLEWGKEDSSRGSLLYAVKGNGAFQQTLDEDSVPVQIYTTECSKTSDAVFAESVEAGHSSHDDSAKIAELLGITKAAVRMDSQCKYAVVGRGDADIYLRLPTRADYEEKIWDHAGGTLIITEAGGKVCDVYGKPLDFSQGRTLAKNKGVIASNGKIHQEVLAAVAEVLKISIE
ncbi:hypothetical protein HK098_004136 [Nowakowskiella sp. JEL0407]|nr:hypothetical protein HK098_004136 [Nowakowskiella sp. JEL0407]